MIKKFFSILFFFIFPWTFTPLCFMAHPLANELIVLESKLRKQKKKLGTLKGNLEKLKIELSKSSTPDPIETKIKKISAKILRLKNPDLTTDLGEKIIANRNIRAVNSKINNLNQDEKRKFKIFFERHIIEKNEIDTHLSSMKNSAILLINTLTKIYNMKSPSPSLSPSLSPSPSPLPSPLSGKKDLLNEIKSGIILKPTQHKNIIELAARNPHTFRSQFKTDLQFRNKVFNDYLTPESTLTKIVFKDNKIAKHDTKIIQQALTTIKEIELTSIALDTKDKQTYDAKFKDLMRAQNNIFKLTGIIINPSLEQYETTVSGFGATRQESTRNRIIADSTLRSVCRKKLLSVFEQAKQEGVSLEQLASYCYFKGLIEAGEKIDFSDTLLKQLITFPKLLKKLIANTDNIQNLAKNPIVDGNKIIEKELNFRNRAQIFIKNLLTTDDLNQFATLIKEKILTQIHNNPILSKELRAKIKFMKITNITQLLNDQDFLHGLMQFPDIFAFLLLKIEDTQLLEIETILKNNQSLKTEKLFRQNARELITKIKNEEASVSPSVLIKLIQNNPENQKLLKKMKIHPIILHELAAIQLTDKDKQKILTPYLSKPNRPLPKTPK